MGLVNKLVYVGPTSIKLCLYQFNVFESMPNTKELNEIFTKAPITKNLFVKTSELNQARKDLTVKTSLIYQAYTAFIKASKEIK